MSRIDKESERQRWGMFFSKGADPFKASLNEKCNKEAAEIYKYIHTRESCRMEALCTQYILSWYDEINRKLLHQLIENVMGHVTGRIRNWEAISQRHRGDDYFEC